MGVLMIFISGGYAMLAIASTMSGMAGFVVALLASGLVGCAQCLGEIGNLAFFKPFSPRVLGAWGAGTGIAGITGPGVYLGLLAMQLSNAQIFALYIPSVVIYYAAFRYLLAQVEGSRGRGTHCATSQRSEAAERSEVMQSAELSWCNFRSACRHTWPILVNLVAVYALEYAVYPGFVNLATLCPVSHSFLSRHAFTISMVMYSIGVTISRSSVAFFQFQNLWVFTVLQAINCLLSVVEATQHTILKTFGANGYLILFGWQVWVGVMGGASYSNCMYAYNTRKDIPNELRVLGINIAFAMSMVGIFAATNLTTVLQTTVLSTSVLFPHGCPPPRLL